MPHDEFYDALRPNVARGAMFFDEQIPEWEQKIDLSKLDMRFGLPGVVRERCIACQLVEKPFWQAIADLFSEHERGVVEAADYGLILPEDFKPHSEAKWAALDSLWAGEVMARRALDAR